jgi:uncharacterized membrane-anchored protein
MQKGM